MSSARLDLRRARGRDTRALILDAAREMLAECGFAATTTRAIAERAGVQLSLVHYHFGGKQQLLAAVLARENELLLERQRALFAGPEPLAEKWRTACAYLHEDLRSGYVRILWELWSVGLSDDELRRLWLEAIDGWRELLTDVAGSWADEHALELPLTPRALATLVGDLFLGAETMILAGDDDELHVAGLDAVTALIDWAEREGRGRSR